MKKAKPTVFVVDDNINFLNSIRRLLALKDSFLVETFSSADDFLKGKIDKSPSCLLLDVRMPGLSGIDLQQELIKKGILIPIIFITGYGDIPMSVKAMKDGAVDFLTKPFSEKTLLDAISRAIAIDVKSRKDECERIKILRCIETLTPREKEVLPWVITGMLNKQIAIELGTAEKTIRVHRSRILRKMSTPSVAELARLSEKVGIHPVIKV
jgi:FixJ family two-component response regulator